LAHCDFNLAALHPAYPIKCRTSTQRTQAPESVDIRKSIRLDPLENTIHVKRWLRIAPPTIGVIDRWQRKSECDAGVNFRSVHVMISPDLAICRAASLVYTG
jgi:hypothetical protein